MTAAKARNEVVKRLAAAGITCTKVKARTWDFTDLARASAICVEVFNPSASIGELFADVPKCSAGGYMVKARGSVAGEPILFS